jgi:hypothetical protein
MNRKKNKNHKGKKNHQTLRSAYLDQSELSDSFVKDLDIEKIKRAEDRRTTIMVKNIPNKYKQFTLLNEFKVNHQGKYDFLYLPIDFEYDANVGYAFINFVHPLFIIDFYNEFMGRNWNNFKS